MSDHRRPIGGDGVRFRLNFRFSPPSRLHKWCRLWSMILAGVASAVVFTATGSARAVMEPQWQPLNGPPGPITHVTLDARQPDRLWVVATAQTVRGDDRSQRAQTGQLRRAQALYRSHDGGETWHPAGNGLPYGDITALSYDSFSGQLYAGLVGGGELPTRWQGLFRSPDDGATWHQVALAPSYRQLRIETFGRSANGTSLYVGAVETTKYPRSFVFRSDDNGATWHEYEALHYEQAPGSILTDLVLDPQDEKRLYLLTYGGLFISKDQGRTWTEASLPTCTPAPRSLVAESGSNPATQLFVACSEVDGDSALTRLLRSNDRGATWSVMEHGPLPGLAQSVALLPGTPPTLLLVTDRGLFRSTNRGEDWESLSSVREVVGAPVLLARPNRTETVLAVTGHGFYISHDAGEHWTARNVGLPANGRLHALFTLAGQPEVVIGGLHWGGFGSGQSLVSVMRSDDGGKVWRTLVTGPWSEVDSVAAHPQRPDHVFVATSVGIVRSRDGGETWAEVSLDAHPVQALAFDPGDADTLYAGVYGGGVYRSGDGGLTWMQSGLERLSVNAVRVTAEAEVFVAVSSYVDNEGGVYRSRDDGRTWVRLTTEESGLESISVHSLLYDGDLSGDLYVTPVGAGVYRSSDGGDSWLAAQDGLPAGSDILSVHAAVDGTLWANRDGGGVYRSDSGGRLWENAAAGLGENLTLALAAMDGERPGVLAATDTAGLWVSLLSDETEPQVLPEAIDARIEIVWPHAGAPVEQAEQANIGLRLFWPGSLVPPPCGWMPQVEVWEAVDTEPAQRLAQAEQRSVEGRPFQFWELNDVDVSAARDSQTKLYFLVRVPGVETATGVWAHGVDPRTHFPVQDTPQGISATEPSAVEARIEIVWPHDGLGREQPVTEADWANVTVALFERGTGLSVPSDWEPVGLALYGAWNQSVGRPLATEAEKSLVHRGAITFPVWHFNNIDVRAARDPASRLYLWVELEGVDTSPTIWAHGADARTRFPAEDEPVAGCGLKAPLRPASEFVDLEGYGDLYVGDAADVLAEALASVGATISDASSGSGRVEGEAADALRSLMVAATRGLVFQHSGSGDTDYLFVAEGVGPVIVGGFGERAYVFWAQDGALWQQWWADGSEMWEALLKPPQIVRAQHGDQGLELVVVGDQLGDEEWTHFQLLRLNSGQNRDGATVSGHWGLLWSWRDAALGTWIGQEGQVALRGGGLNQLQLTGPLPDEFEDAPRIFAEVDRYSKQLVSSVWERQGDAYQRGTMVLVPTPMTTLSRFISALRDGDLGAASQWVDDETLIEEALGHTWSLPRPEGERLLAVGGYLTTEGDPIDFFSEADPEFRFRVYFAQKAGTWNISSIDVVGPS